MEEIVELLKEILFWWMLMDNLMLIIAKGWRKERIIYLKKLDKKS